MITIPNDRLLQTIDPHTPLTKAFEIADSVLHEGVQGISDLITEHSMINLDFADVKSIMKDAGSALMGIGRASGENRAAIAAQNAIESPLIEVSIDGARGVLFSIAGGADVTMTEMQEAAEVITASVSPDANIIWGASVRPELEDEIVVTVVATGFDSDYYREKDLQSQALYMGADTSVAAPAVEAKSYDEAMNAELNNGMDMNMGMNMNNDMNEVDNVHPEVPGSSDFTETTTVNMWDNIRPDMNNDDSDIPSILRRRKKNRN